MSTRESLTIRRFDSPAAAIGRDLRRAFCYLYLALAAMSSTFALAPARAFGLGEQALLATWLAVTVVLLALLLTARRHRPAILVAAVALAAYALASSTWAAEPGTSLGYALMLAGNILGAYLIACELSPAELARVLLRVIVTMAILGLLLYVAGVAEAQYVDAHRRPNLLGLTPLRGLFPHKITAGLFAVIGVVLAASLLRGVRRLATLALLVLTIAMTGSSTAVVLLAVGLATLWATASSLRSRRSYGAHTLVICSVVAAAVALLSFQWREVLGALGRDLTLTGRTLLWDWGISASSERPFFGWGFRGYIGTPESEMVRRSIPEFRNYDVPHFHQSFIQTAVDLGLIMLVVLVAIILSTLRRAYQLGLTSDAGLGAGLVALVSTVVVAGFVSNVLWTNGSLITIVLLALRFALPAGTTSSGAESETLRLPRASTL